MFTRSSSTCLFGPTVQINQNCFKVKKRRHIHAVLEKCIFRIGTIFFKRNEILAKSRDRCGMVWNTIGRLNRSVLLYLGNMNGLDLDNKEHMPVWTIYAYFSIGFLGFFASSFRVTEEDLLSETDLSRPPSFF